MLKKSCYIFVFVLSFIKIDPVFSSTSCDSSWLEGESQKEEVGTKSTIAPKSTVVPKERPPTPTNLKIKQTLKRSGCCFCLGRRYKY
jgi:hypothetical protein